MVTWESVGGTEMPDKQTCVTCHAPFALEHLYPCWEPGLPERRRCIDCYNDWLTVRSREMVEAAYPSLLPAIRWERLGAMAGIFLFFVCGGVMLGCTGLGIFCGLGSVWIYAVAKLGSDSDRRLEQMRKEGFEDGC